MNLKPNDRVYVTDPALAELRAIMRTAGIDPHPNHTGTISEYADTSGGSFVYINFDDGSCAPYTLDEIRPLRPEDEHPTYHRACAAGGCDLEHGHDGLHTAWVPE